MITFDLDRMMTVTNNKFYMVLAIVDRVLALRRGTEPKVDRKGRDLISVAIEEFEKSKLDYSLQDAYLEMVQQKRQDGEL
ncbi:MAG: DNA-directed RNA polymerase subunit omega [Candidatus Riflebacteria bacterium]|nr:DNA-directed RNA polymerase subunit omega [Candidatus Riflebacteria bacterium]